MIRILYRHRSGTVILDCPLDQLAGALKDPQSRFWIDLSAPTQTEYERILVDAFHFHPLAIDDAINDVHVPKIDDYGSYLYLVVHTFTLGAERMDINSDEMDVFLGANFLITSHKNHSAVIEKLWTAEYHAEHGLSRGPAMLLYELLNTQLDNYIPILDAFEDQVEELGDIIFTSPAKEVNRMLNEILTAKTSALRLRRILMPQREVLSRLARIDYAAVPASAQIYFHDVYDHVLRLTDMVDSMRDLVNSTITTYLTVTNNRLNEIMKVLTVISTIFMPLSFLAGVYGMNFRHMPELNWAWAYPLTWLAFVAIAAAMLSFFRRRRWL
jgi:magnesium transporter